MIRPLQKLPQTIERFSLPFATIIVLFIGILAFRAWLDFGTHSRQVGILQGIVNSTAMLLSSMKDAETGLRGFMLTGEERYLDPYKQARSKAPVTLQEILAISAGSHLEQDLRIERLRPLVETKLAELESKIEVRRVRGIHGILPIVETEQEKAATDEIRAIYAELVSGADLKKYSGQAHASAENLWFISSVGSTALFILLCLATLTIHRKTRQREQLIALLEQKEAETRHFSDRLQTALNSIADAIITTDAAGKTLLLNAAAQSLTGWNQEEAAGKPVEEVFVVQNAQSGEEKDNPVPGMSREGRIAGLENCTRLIARDGRQIPIEDTVAPISENGKNTGAILVFRDISGRLEAEESMKLTIESAPSPMFTVGRDGRIELINSRAEILFGYDHGELLGKPMEKLVPDRYRVDHRGLHSSFMRKPVARPMGAGLDLFGLRKDGTEVPIEIGINLISTSQGDRVIAAINDISARKRAEQELRAANEELRRIYHLMEPAACFVCDMQGEIVYWNPGTAELYGFSAGEAIGKIGQSLLKTEFPVPLDTIVAQVETAGAWDGDLLQTRSDGQQIIVASHWALHKDSEGQPVAILQVNLDITAAKESARALQAANAALARANETLNHFANAATHDLQEPLRMIAAYSQLLVEGYSGQLDSNASMYMDFITNGTKRMSELLTDLLAYARLTSEEEESKASMVNLEAVFQTAIENCRTAITEARANITRDPLPTVLGHKLHFVQLIQNLISNALKYRSDHHPQVHVSAERQNGDWRIGVKDNGIGIEPEYQKQIFVAFKRLHGKSIPGTGIGLAICNRVVDRYGGKIWVESQPGAGSTFYFTLPNAAKADAAHG